MKFNKLVIVALSSASLFLFACAVKPSGDDGRKREEEKLIAFAHGAYKISSVVFDSLKPLASELDSLNKYATSAYTGADQLLVDVIDDNSIVVGIVSDFRFGSPCTVSMPGHISYPKNGQVEITIDMSAVGTIVPSGCYRLSTAAMFFSGYDTAIDGVYNLSFTGDDFTMSSVADPSTVISGSKK